MLVEQVLVSITDNEFPALIGNLDDEAQNVLMKYLYRAMSRFAVYADAVAEENARAVARATQKKKENYARGIKSDVKPEPEPVHPVPPVANSAALMLKFHAHLVEKAGVGSIVRAMADRRTV